MKAAMVHYIKDVAKQNAARNTTANMASPGMVYFEGGVWHSIEQLAPDFFKTSQKLRGATPFSPGLAYLDAVARLTLDVSGLLQRSAA